MDEIMRATIQRVYRLEVELAEVQRRLGVDAVTPPVDLTGVAMEPAGHAPAALPGAPQPAAPYAAGARGMAARPAATPAAAAAAARAASRSEADVVGAWLGRAGALAVLIGAAFGFTYAVNQGLIGPAARVLIGIAAGSAFLAWGGYARARRWDFFSQAVSAGGLALIYLSILASSHLYDLIPGPLAFVGLAAVVAGGALLALRTDSPSLAALAVGGGFLNPLLVMRTDSFDATTLLLYVLALDLSLAVTLQRKWRWVEMVTGFGTFVVYSVAREEATFAQDVIWSTVFAAVFIALPYARRRAAVPADLTVPLAAAAAYFLHVGGLIEEMHPRWTGAFAWTLAAVFAWLAVVAHQVRRDALLARAMTGAAVAFVVLFVPAQLDGVSIGTAWAVQGAVLTWVGLRVSSRELGIGGLVAMSLATIATAVSLVEYDATRLLLSTDSLNIVIRIAAFAAAARMLSTSSDRESRERAALPALAALLFTLGWLSVETVTAIDRSTLAYDVREQAKAFALSALWALYAAIALLVGVKADARRLRLFAVSLLGVVVAKLVLSDVWLLRTAYRIGAFVAVGMLLLLSSVMYQRLRDLVASDADDDGAPAAEQPTPGFVGDGPPRPRS